MEAITRREVMGAAALGGTVALAAMAGKTANAQESDEAKPAFDRDAEEKKVMDCGMTEEEAECWLHVSDAAGSFFKLPKLHSMDEHEVAHAIHVIQNKLLGRPTYREYLKISKE